jgi:hypothetical protein
MVYLRAERVFILKHYFAWKSFGTVCEAFSNVYHDKGVGKKTIHPLVIKFRYTGSACERKHAQRRTALTRETFCNVEQTLSG